MKYQYLSFLFFLSLSYCFCLNNRQEQDSLAYYSKLANAPKTPSSLAKAYVFFNKKKEESLLSKDTVSTINHLRQIAIIQYKLGDYYGSETSVVKAISLLDALKKNEFTSESKVGLYNELGGINRESTNYIDALKYYDKALNFATSRLHINIINNNKALIHIEQKNYVLAESQLKKIYENSLKIGDSIQISRVLGNLGYVQSKLKREGALEKLVKALKLKTTIDYRIGKYINYKYLFEHYKDLQDNTKALFYANKGYECAKTIKSASLIEDALSNLVALNIDPHIIEYKTLKDSTQKARQIAENKYAHAKFNYLKQEKLAIQHQLQKEQEKAKRIKYQYAGLSVLLFSIFLFFILKARHKKDKIQQVYNTETRISKKVHDEVANDIHNVMTKLESSPEFKEELLDDLESIYNRTRDISKENSTIDTDANYTDLLKDLVLSYKNDSVTIITKDISKIHWESLDNLKKTTLYRVLQELMVNMKKHSQASLVALSFSQTKHKISISYSDNGVGTHLKKSTGLLNVENRIKSINGTITFESSINKGFKVKITV